MKKNIKKIRLYFLKLFGIKKVIDNQQKMLEIAISNSNKQDELLKAITFNNTIADSQWLKYKSFSPGGWAVDYSLLYTLYRVLNDVRPTSILEFGLGQSSKLIHQYVKSNSNAHAITCEHDKEWVDFFMKSLDGNYEVNIQMVELQEVYYKNEKTLSINNIETTFQNTIFDLIIIDAPFGSPRYSRSQILELANNNLADNFCIIIDDYNRKGEIETANELLAILENKELKSVSSVYGGTKKHFLVCNDKMKFLTSM